MLLGVLCCALACPPLCGTPLGPDVSTPTVALDVVSWLTVAAEVAAADGITEPRSGMPAELCLVSLDV